VIIDYLQLLRPSMVNRNTTRENEVAQISAGIKALAKELHIPIIVLAQLNRQAEQPGQKPRLSHLRESGAIEQDADIVALLHRERDTDTGGGAAREEREAELIVAKNRNGSTGVAYLSFQPEFTLFKDRSYVADRDVPQTAV
jgi:replicative DNA helicase